MIKLGVLGSTNGTDLQHILGSISDGKLNASVNIIISNKKNAKILQKGKKNNIHSVFMSHKGQSRKEFDQAITKKLQAHGVQLILLIGFMRILSGWFCRTWKNKLLNVHPSLLPKYAGGINDSVHGDVLKNGDKITGCTIHQVTEKVDGGPILIQKTCRVSTSDTIDTLKKRVQKLEGEAFVEAIQLIHKSAYAE